MYNELNALNSIHCSYDVIPNSRRDDISSNFAYKIVLYFQDEDTKEASIREEEAHKIKSASELAVSEESVTSKYSISPKDVPFRSKGDTLPTPMPSGQPPLHPITSSIDDTNGHSTLSSSSAAKPNMLFPGGKFFGLFPRIGIEDQVSFFN